MKDIRKYILALIFAMITFVVMMELTILTGWKLELLIGWFPITAWFATIGLINSNNGIRYKKTPLRIWLFGFVLALAITLGCSLLDMPIILNGVITGLAYNFVTTPELEEEESEKKDTDF